jgi:hypothetical protein
MNFKIWLESFNNDITIDYRGYETSVNEALKESFNMLEDHYEKIANFNYNNFINMIKTSLSQYPSLNELLKSIYSKNANHIFAQQNKLREWLYTLDSNISIKLRDVNRQIFTYIDTLSTSAGIEKEKEHLEQKAIAAKNETKTIMEGLKEKIQQAIGLIENWNSSAIIVRPYISRDEFNSLMLAPSTTAEIIMGHSGQITFTLFLNDGKIEIDDILEGGDEDFFKDSNEQSDYFNLIEKLKNPTSKQKIITLYTARPRKDREVYLNKKQVPINIFLTNDYNHAEGLASDLSSDEKRDIWKVRINTKYLTQTLDGRIKYYQVTTNNAPVESMELT